MKPKFIGNCPICGFPCKSVSATYTPRHGHIKWGGKWLPPCKGTGYPMDNVQQLETCKPSWEFVLSKMFEFEDLEDDWDGNGSTVPKIADIKFATTLAEYLKNAGWEPPLRTILSVNGTIIFEFSQTRTLEILPDRSVELDGCDEGPSLSFVDIMNLELLNVRQNVRS